ncbi:ABC transporter substrate-binding protein [Subtercola vilae]|uniref:ABC transporter substrate-binding protein n=1 Tax=Subtercola vilae TaxID=2056433 RepID=UPI0013756F35|nr:ABC transporter substrate-binding protein [Subtercola vilae]
MKLSRTGRLASIAALGVAAAIALSACSSGASTSPSTSGAAASYGDIDIQLSYLKNTEFAGEFFADKNGYFTSAGFNSVSLTAGGSSAVSAEAQVATGKSLIGISSPLITAPAVVKGAAIKIIAADYQKNPFNVVSLASSPLKTAASLKGKTIAVSDFNTLAWQAFLAANNLTSDDVKTVPQTNGPDQLASGQVDGYNGYTTSFTGTVGTAKTPSVQFLLADQGLPLVGETLVASQDTIDNHRDELKAALKAIIKGWKDAVADPATATKITVETYGKDQNFNYDSQLAAITIQNTLMVTDDTKANGLLTITPALVDQSITALKLAKIDITADQLFDTSVINDVYKENPDLK